VDEISFDENGLVPCVVQDARTGEVLTLAYMNREALERTRSTGETWFWSRSRGELWHKGETSGNVQRVKELRWDCDADALLALVEPTGPACHTGERTCFHNGELEPPVPAEALPVLERTIARRRAERPEGSYTAELLADPGRIGDKVREEAEEVARAAVDEPDERVAAEAADVLYHLAVLLASRGLRFDDALAELNGRRRAPGQTAQGS
jgi:phosphoribosyl-ATP pyrophosphohydrolase/phosphoribosyl-AMP cyclohydrolase